MKTMNPPAAQAIIATSRPMGLANPKASNSGLNIVAAVTIATVPEPMALRKTAPIIKGASIPIFAPDKYPRRISFKADALKLIQKLHLLPQLGQSDRLILEHHRKGHQRNIPFYLFVYLGMSEVQEIHQLKSDNRGPYKVNYTKKCPSSKRS